MSLVRILSVRLLLFSLLVCLVGGCGGKQPDVPPTIVEVGEEVVDEASIDARPNPDAVPAEDASIVSSEDSANEELVKDVAEDPQAGPSETVETEEMVVEDAVAEADDVVAEDVVASESDQESPADRVTPFRVLLPTTNGPLLVDVAVRIAEQSLAEAFDQRIDNVIKEATGKEDSLTWPMLFRHVSNDREQFGRAANVNAQQHRNLIQLFDRNRNKKPEKDEVTRFLFRGGSVRGPFRMSGSDYYRQINRTQSAVFAALDRNGNHLLDAEEVDAATESLMRLDRDGDRRVAMTEVVSVPADGDPAWNNRRNSRWGEVAMDLSGYIDWDMLSYTVGGARRDGAFGQSRGVMMALDQDGDGTVDADEARSLLTIPPDLTLAIDFPLTGGEPTIAVRSLAQDLDPLVNHQASPGQVTVDGPSLRLIARVTDRRAGPNQIPPEAFAALDGNSDGGLDETEIPEAALREYSFEDLDTDNDGKLTFQEITEGMSPKSPIWSVQVRSRGAESPDGVFTWLDRDQDLVLSTREMMGVVERLRQLSESGPGEIRATDIPDSFLIQFGRGDPDQDAQLFALSPSNRRPSSQWPRWAQSMDSNEDGDISRLEFPGSSAKFDALDHNGDGFIDQDEIQ